MLETNRDNESLDCNESNNMMMMSSNSVLATSPAPLPTLYEYYTEGGIQTGLSAVTSEFTLNTRPITVFSGAMHYFRVPRAHWRDRLRKMRAAGLNAVETYIAWNLHEPQPGQFEWGDGGDSDMEDFLHLKEYLKMAQEEDLLAIVRPGPYICSEWEFGGMPSWLLREKDIKVRTSDESFMKHVTRYFNALLPILAMLQFTKGGPIIAFQVENEYGSTGSTDKAYLEALKELMIQNGIVELLVTSDSPTASGDRGSVPGALQTANFQVNPEAEFQKLQQLQPGKPLMAMEYWTGWFDHWSEKHHKRSVQDFEDILERILKYPASVNLYMFHGGTNWGFMNGANIAGGSGDYQPDTTSYDYDAPLTEAGDYTDKYCATKTLIKQYNKVKTRLPDPPALKPRIAYPVQPIVQQLTLNDIIEQSLYKLKSNQLEPMELLPTINNNNTGQSYGYIVYRKTNVNIPPNSILKINGRVCDTVMVLVNGQLKSKPLTKNEDLDGFGYWRMKNSILNLGPDQMMQNATLELIVENYGRNNFGSLNQFEQFKGLWQGPVSINERILNDWEIVPLEFRTKWTRNLSNWHSFDDAKCGPTLYRALITIASSPQDTFLDMSGWMKGFVVVNGFVLGRYALIGPQMTLYLPGPLLRQGENEILIFEHFAPASNISFLTDPIYKSSSSSTMKLPFH